MAIGIHKRRWIIEMEVECVGPADDARFEIGGSGHCTVDWGDGAVEQGPLSTDKQRWFWYSTQSQGLFSHRYDRPGRYAIRVSGSDGSVRFFDCSGGSSMTGRYTILKLAGCTRLVRLHCDYNRLVSLEAGDCRSLEVLRCSENRLKYLEVKSCIRLAYLICDKNQLASLELGRNRKLKELDCGINALTALHLANNRRLEELDCGDNALTELHIERNRRLKEFFCEKNRLTELHIGKNRKLQALTCSENALSALDTSRNRRMDYLDCEDNKIEGLDFSHNPKLKDLSCESNRLERLDMRQNQGLSYLACENNRLTDLCLPTQGRELYAVFCRENPLSAAVAERIIEELPFRGDRKPNERGDLWISVPLSEQVIRAAEQNGWDVNKGCDGSKAE
ncbi:hypothetical protein [uncultured Rikenella sp.]|uniref:leucine-rich repeat domain-containing protein n=1 Tax=uncultured Rikenella sp. TaxID=368003 RepID=UPI0025D86EA9|nr:hypothetical protein [uncultured Rikenella sp.]